MSKTCKKGQILRDAYDREGYYRRAYRRKDGTKVSAVRVGPTHVDASCIRDMGKPGKGPKILPPLRDDIHLSRYGYGIHKPANIRRAALREASKDNDMLKVLQRLNSIRNRQGVPANREIFGEDVKYMSSLYSKEKKRRGNMRGGAIPDGFFGKDFMANMPGMRQDVDSIGVFNKSCNDGVCHNYRKLYESRRDGDKFIEFMTLGKDNADDIINFNRQHNVPEDGTRRVINELNRNTGNVIGIKSDNNLKGYFDFIPEDHGAKIDQFLADQGYRGALYKYMEKMLHGTGFNSVFFDVPKNGNDVADKINRLVARNNFKVSNKSPDLIRLQKNFE